MTSKDEKIYLIEKREMSYQVKKHFLEMLGLI